MRSGGINTETGVRVDGVDDEILTSPVNSWSQVRGSYGSVFRVTDISENTLERLRITIVNSVIDVSKVGTINLMRMRVFIFTTQRGLNFSRLHGEPPTGQCH